MHEPKPSTHGHTIIGFEVIASTGGSEDLQYLGVLLLYVPGGESCEQQVLFFVCLVINQDGETFGAEDVFHLILPTAFGFTVL